MAKRGKGSPQAGRIELPKVTIDPAAGGAGGGTAGGVNSPNGRVSEKQFDLVRVPTAEGREADRSVGPTTEIARKDTKTVRQRGLTFERTFSKEGVHPFDELKWEKRDSKIIDEKGNVIFEQSGVEAPSSWSQLAIDIASSKYFRKKGLQTKEGREYSVKQLVSRVAKAIRGAGEQLGGYFASTKDAQIFEDDLSWLLVNQAVAFNSPVWFNCGLYQSYGIEGSAGNWFFNPVTGQVEQAQNAYEHPQCSACFIQSIHDDLRSIFNLVKNEAMLFKYGSGTGTNFSTLRAKGETLSGGGKSSGVMSFLKVLDAGAGSIKSGGTTRRAAKMVILDMDHPEIVEFIDWKVKEEEKARVLIEHGGFAADFNGEAYQTVSGQNSNNSVRISDEFIKAYLEDKEWSTYWRTSGEVAQTYKARELMDKIAQAAWRSADPGVQFDDTIQQWNPVAATDRINATNPCAEFCFIDDTACNLASFNLMKFSDSEGNFKVEQFRKAVRLLISAMEIIVDFASYPTKKIAERSHDFRPLGLGYANLGTLLMVNGIPYDSVEGRAWAGAITALLHCESYASSAELSAGRGPFNGFSQNREPFMNVVRAHRDAAYKIDATAAPKTLIEATHEAADRMLSLGEQHGFRNAQVTVIAPTGTIGLLMDCDTTGVEPDFALVKYKKLAGGGFFKIINQSVPRALRKLGYSARQIDEINRYIAGSQTLEQAPHVNRETLKQKGLTDEEVDKVNRVLPSVFDFASAFGSWTLGKDCLKRLGIKGDNVLAELGFSSEQIEQASNFVCGMMTIEGAPHLKPEHLSVFDCANKNGKHGVRYIEPMGHVRMMAAVQPFISGSMSKTVNLPSGASVEDIKEVYLESWKLGLKALSVYRDGSKLSQPLATSSEAQKERENGISTGASEVGVPTAASGFRPQRRRLPDERKSITHKFTIAGHDGYLTIGLFEDGSPGEIFIRMAKEGSTIAGLMDSFAIAVSMGLQYGVPLETIVSKFAHVRFDPSGFTPHPKIKIAKSVIDYIARYLAYKFLPKERWHEVGLNGDHGNGTENHGKETKPPADQPTIFETPAPPADQQTSRPADQPTRLDLIGDSPTCSDCGGMMTRSGTCYKCMNCGSTSGCS